MQYIFLSILYYIIDVIINVSMLYIFKLDIKFYILSVLYYINNIYTILSYCADLSLMHLIRKYE